MKTLKNLFLFMAVLGLLVSCSKSDHFWGDDPLGNTEKGGPNASVMVTVPLKADFTVWLNSLIPGHVKIGISSLRWLEKEIYPTWEK